MTRRVSRITVVLTLLCLAWPASAGELIKMRTLRGEEQGAAQAACDAAWQLMYDWQTAAFGRDAKPGDGRALWEQAVAAHLDLIARYPSTEFEARASLMLVSLYRTGGDAKRGDQMIERTLERFAGTPVQRELCFTVGLDCLQRLHDAAEALKWFDRIPLPKLPRAAAEDKLAVQREEVAHEYAKVYQQAAKCEVQLGNVEAALRRYDRLTALLPESQAGFQRNLATEVDNALGDHTLKAVHPALLAWKASGRKELRPDAAWAASLVEVQPTPEAVARAEAAKAPIDRLIAWLHRPWTARPTDEEAAAVIDAARPQADEAVRRIMDEFNNGDDVLTYRHYAVRALGQLGTPAAREALLDIAIGNTLADLPTYSEVASRLYVDRLENKSDARKLLTSSIPGVLSNGLQALAGQPLDETFMKDLERLMAYRSEKEPVSEISIRMAATRVIAEAPGQEFAERRVQAVVAAVADVSRNATAADIWWPGYYTHGEAMYQMYANALSKIPGADDALAASARTAAGPAAQCLTIARAARGDAAMREGLKAILRDREAGMFRAWAATALSVVGTAEDLPLLRELAAGDPLARDPGGCMRPPAGEEVKPIYPVRDAAQQAVQQMEARAAK